MNNDVLFVTKPDPGVWMIRLNRAEVRNALNVELRDRLGDEFLAVQRDAAVRCVVIAGSEKAFCAGADLNGYLDATRQKSLKDEWSEPGTLCERVRFRSSRP
jgi:enoyl-CoA hydratase/carnithine racemase